MIPFSALIAIDPDGSPKVYDADHLQFLRCSLDVFLHHEAAVADAAYRNSHGNPTNPPQRVLIIEDTEENRGKLGMEAV